MADIEMPAWWPRCIRCGKPVQRYSWTPSERYKPMTLRVECHGREALAVVPWLTAIAGSVTVFPE